MDQSKILIIGSKGQLGLALQEKYPRATAIDSDELDITDAKAVTNHDWSGVEIILNVAAYTNVDGAETPEGRRAAWAVNASAVANLAKVARNHSLTLAHISTDYVFDGAHDNHSEDEPLSPLSVYGASKAAGDIAAASADKHYILRTSWVIGDGKNFVRTMMGLAEKDVSPTVVSDQIGRLTFTPELVRAIDHLLAHEAGYGTYNVTNNGPSASWADIARQIFNTLGRVDLKIHKNTTDEYYAGKAVVAPRPLQSTLDLDKIHSTGFISTDWREELKNYIDKEKKIK